MALLAFSGSVAAQCVEKEMPFLVNQVIDWTTAYINTNLASWIHDNGGWVSIGGSGYFIMVSNYGGVKVSVIGVFGCVEINSTVCVTRFAAGEVCKVCADCSGKQLAPTASFVT